MLRGALMMAEEREERRSERTDLSASYLGGSCRKQSLLRHSMQLQSRNERRRTEGRRVEEDVGKRYHIIWRGRKGRRAGKERE